MMPNEPSKTANLTERGDKPAPARQQGMVTLALCMIVLFISSLMVFQSSTAMLYEIKTGNNVVRQSQALEAARGGLAASFAWLAASGTTSALINNANWASNTTGPSGNNQKANSSLFPLAISSQTVGSTQVNISMWRNSTASNVLTLLATSSGDGISSVSQRVQLSTATASSSTAVTLNLSTFAPIVVNESFGVCDKGNKVTSCIHGNPSVKAGDLGVAITTSKTSAETLTGHLAITGKINYNAFTGTAWDLVFPKTSPEQMKAAADFKNIYYYDDKRPPDSPWHLSIGTASNPVVLVFAAGAGCPKINGGTVIYGIVYYAEDCSTNGWGGAKIYGTMVAEGIVTDLNANTEFHGWKSSFGTGTINLPPIISTTTSNTLSVKTASWRDF